MKFVSFEEVDAVKVHRCKDTIGTVVFLVRMSLLWRI
jgi:hypothetical protein